ncbi:ABC transporter permease [Lutibaculum baratangense]|uniref:Hydroxymethylpyrimidine ABC transporter, transmembrane component n=1 Tax=Lutibaculum baratangense AMV1 TaxID=631454 RepID=V4R539_9HYPH|nr:ABC transporter permease [Lutibaculum baratangense]ESR27057.1 Hydroxymethylpyrimidine ABC transporter, transmembrane component [Lutibaculum baratangense AMV1]
MRSALARRVLRVAVPAAVILAIWQAAIVLLEIRPYILPAPLRVAEALADDWRFLAYHGFITLSEIVLGLLLGAALGVATALTVSLFPRAGGVMLPVMVASQALPVFAIAPLLVIWFGYGLASKVVMATLIIFFPVASAFLDGLRRTNTGFLELARLSGASPWRTLLLVRLPAALSGLASGLRVAAAVAPIGAVVGEWVGASKGLGFVMLQANARVQTDRVFAALFILALTAILVRALVERLSRKMVPWVAED